MRDESMRTFEPVLSYTYVMGSAAIHGEQHCPAKTAKALITHKSKEARDGMTRKWVAAEELSLSCYIEESLLFSNIHIIYVYMRAHYGSLT